MVQYRRHFAEGGCYFFTANLKDRSKSYLTDYIGTLRGVFQKVKSEHPFKIEAIVILLGHIHIVWQLPDKDNNYSLRWKKIKRYFTGIIMKAGVKLHKNKHGEYDLWQRRFWEHTIRDERDFENHVNYIHYNPIKHAYVKTLKDRPYSSFHRFAENGQLSKD